MSNPYAPPESGWSLDDRDICVDGRCLVVRPSVVLPQRCIHTNEEVRGHRHVQVIHWAPEREIVLFRRKCSITYSINPTRRRAAFRRRAIVSVPLFGALVWGAGWLALFFLVPIGIYLLSATDDLDVDKFEDGRFWITGCGADFLRGCEDEFGSISTPPRPISG